MRYIKSLELKINLPKTKKVGGKDDKNPLKDLIVKLPSNTQNIIVLSPHLDDAILSMGSLITYMVGLNIKLTVLTIFTEGQPGKSNAISTLLSNANHTDSMVYFEARRQEDKHALGILGVKKILHLNYVDSAWRRKESGDSIYPDSQLTKISNLETNLIKKLEYELGKYIKSNQDELVFAPLALGNHVDHQIARNIATKLTQNIVYYRDFPYSNFFKSNESYMREKFLNGVDWRGDYRGKKDAILKYKTQRYSLFYSGPMTLPHERYYLNLRKQ